MGAAAALGPFACRAAHSVTARLITVLRFEPLAALGSSPPLTHSVTAQSTKLGSSLSRLPFGSDCSNSESRACGLRVPPGRGRR